MAAADPTAHARRRRAVGVGGEILVTLGALLGLFVVWLLWWTDVAGAHHQAQVVAGLDWTSPSKPEPIGGVDSSGVIHHGPAPYLGAPEHATTFATLRVPRWGSDYVRPISEGTSNRDVLDVLGIGHYTGTQMPGQIGNFATAGHRTTYGAPYNRIEELQVGDPLVVQTQDVWYVYRVSDTRVVMPTDVEVIAPVPGDPAAVPSVAMMTMTTCHPMYSARYRYVVHAELDYWMYVVDGAPAEIDAAARATPARPAEEG